MNKEERLQRIDTITKYISARSSMMDGSYKMLPRGDYEAVLDFCGVPHEKKIPYQQVKRILIQNEQLIIEVHPDDENQSETE